MVAFFGLSYAQRCPDENYNITAKNAGSIRLNINLNCSCAIISNTIQSSYSLHLKPLTKTSYRVLVAHSQKSHHSLPAILTRGVVNSLTLPFLLITLPKPSPTTEPRRSLCTVCTSLNPNPNGNPKFRKKK